VLDPFVAVDTLEGDREAGRADQDERHHRGDAHRRLESLHDQVAQFLDLPCPKAKPDDRGEHHGEGELERDRLEGHQSDQETHAGGGAAGAERPFVELGQRRIAHYR